MSTPLARAVSILGHPLLLLSLALLALQATRGTPMQLALLVLGLCVFAMLVMGYSHRQVRRGRWAHVDASHASERRRLNRFLLIVLAAGALLAWATGTGLDVTLTLVLAGAMVVAALASTRWCKLSLHLAFAVFAALLLARVAWWASAALLLFAAAIAWSRLALSRHAPRDLVAGALAGLIAGGVFLLVVPAWRG